MGSVGPSPPLMSATSPPWIIVSRRALFVALKDALKGQPGRCPAPVEAKDELVEIALQVLVRDPALVVS